LPILIRCSSCGMQLQVRDELAGRRVACPGCKSVLLAPAAAPAAVPPAPDNPFGFDSPAPPPAELMSLDDAEGRGDEEAPRARRRWEREGRTRLYGGRWGRFGAGCRLVKFGLWVEFAGVAYLVAFLEVGLADVVRPGPWGFVPMFGLMLAGSVLVGLGRLKLLAIPPDTGAAGLMTGAAALSGIRVLALLAGTGLAIAAATADNKNPAAGVKYEGFAFMAVVLGMLAGGVAEWTVVTGMAVVGGAMPDDNLRRRAGFVGFVLQMIALAYVVLVALVYFLGVAGDLAAGPGAGGGGAAPAPRPGGGLRVGRGWSCSS